MKKTIITLLLAVTLISPLSASAQTVTNEQLLSIIQSLMTQVLALMEQLKKIESTQTTQSQTLGAIQQQVTPVVVVPVQPSLSVEYGPVSCVITQEKFGNCNNSGSDCYADVYNISVPVTYGTLSKLLEHSETNLPNHTHKDRTSISTHTFNFTIGNYSGSKEVVVPACQ